MRRRIPLRVLMADPAPLPADCGALHPDTHRQQAYSAEKMAAYDRKPSRARMVEAIAGDPDLAAYIMRRTATEDREEIDAIARDLWAISR